VKELLLPGTSVELRFEVKGRAPETFTPHLDTVIIDAYDEEPGEPVAVELVWRASVRAPRRAKDANIIVTEREKRS